MKTAAEMRAKAIEQLIAAARRLPQHIANNYEIAEPLRILDDPEGSANIANFFGTWPGDETDDELQAKLKDLRKK